MSALRQSRRRNRLCRFSAEKFCEPLETRVLLSGTAPSSIVGDTLMAAATSGTPDLTSIVFAASGNSFTDEDLIDAATGSGTYTYESTGSATATISAQTSVAVTIQLTFTTGASGTYRLTNASDPASNESGVFNLFVAQLQNLAPNTINGENLTFAVAGGGGEGLPNSGSVITQFFSGGTYDAVNAPAASNPGAIQGTYVYTVNKQSVGSQPGIGEVEETPSGSPNTYGYLTFTLATGGVYYLTDATGSNTFTDFSYGTFTLAVSTTIDTITTVNSTVNPVAQGTAVILKATVSPNTGGGNTATGTVTFLDGTTTLGTGTLNAGGVASLTTSALTFGTHPISAVYAGDGNFAGSTSYSAFNEAITLTHAQNMAYVTQIYHDILNRHRTLAGWHPGLSCWMATPHYKACAGPEQQHGILFRRGDFVLRNLSRTRSDPTGLQHWVNLMATGTSPETVRADIVSSQEYYNDGGGTAAGYVTELYESLLDRAPDAGGLAHWETVLAQQGAAAVAGGLIDSPEFDAGIISGYYETYLDRAADAGGTQYWVSQLESGVTEQVVISDFTSSAEYLTLHDIS